MAIYEDDQPAVEQQEEEIKKKEQWREQQEEVHDQQLIKRLGTKDPSRYDEKNHSRDLIIGDKSASIQTRNRNLESTFEEVNFSSLSKIEPNCFDEARIDEYWANYMEE